MRIRVKTVLAVLPLAALSAAATVWFAHHAVRNVITDEVVKKGMAAAESFAADPATVSAFESGQEGELLPALNGIAMRSGARYAVALSPRGSVLSHTNVTEQGRLYGSPETRDALLSEETHRVTQEVGGDLVLEVFVPVWQTGVGDDAEDFLLLGNEHRSRVGTVVLGMPLQHAIATAVRISGQVLAIVALFTLLAVIGMLIGIQRILAPVPGLVRATERLAAGALGETVPAQGRDEIAQLARSFNQMSENLARTTVSKDHLSGILENLHDALLVTDSDGNVELINPRALALLDLSRDEAVGAPTWRVLSRIEADPVGGRQIRAEHLVAASRDAIVVQRDGRRIPVLLSASILRDGEGRRIGYAITAKDITDRKRAEDQLQNSYSLLQASLEATADGILVVDSQGAITSFNERFQQMWQIPDEVMAPRHDDRILRFVLGQLVDPHEFLNKVQSLYRQPEQESFDVLRFRDGRVFERYSRPQRLGNACVGRVWSFRDVTDRARAEEALRQSEEQLRQSQKMEAIGTLAGGVAHDFNNILTVITGYCQLIRSRMSESHPNWSPVEEIEKAAARAMKLTRHLLAFSRKQVVQARTVEPNDIVADMEKMLRRLIGEHIQLSTLLGADLGAVRADPSHLEQVVLNLVINARDAMPDGGSITVETARVSLDEAYAERHPGIEPGEHIMIAVSDSGCGMDKETQARIFEPFFTTKGAGKGTGLGLSTVYGIVQQCGGSVSVYSEVGVGSVFKIYLPRVQAEETLEAEAVLDPEVDEACHASILLVEDETEVREIVCEVLTQAGHRVTEASDGEVALQIFRQRPFEFDLVITDVVMPKMGGGALAKELEVLQPGVRLIFMSGYTEDAVVRQGVIAEKRPFIQKPFAIEDVLTTVRSALSDRATRAEAA